MYINYSLKIKLISYYDHVSKHFCIFRMILSLLFFGFKLFKLKYSTIQQFRF